jgi:protein SCO1
MVAAPQNLSLVTSAATLRGASGARCLQCRVAIPSSPGGRDSVGLRLLIVLFGCSLLIAGRALGIEALAGTSTRTFETAGVVKAVEGDGKTVVVAHEAIPNYMDAMTMPFKVKVPAEVAGLHAGDKIRFRLQVTDTESWIEGISQVVGQASRLSTGHPAPDPGNAAVPLAAAGGTPAPLPRHPLLAYAFTNELGQVTRLGDFRGQALAITFFFTRCPIPDYCPRLSKNFEEASQKLSALPSGPTNWHFLSVTFDPGFDNPRILKAYGERYQYDPTHWSFLTGPKEKIGELARASDVTFEPAEGFINHNFRTLIIDAAGHLQMIFPTGGNLSDAIVAEVLKAAAVPSDRAPRLYGAAEPGSAARAQ